MWSATFIFIIYVAILYSVYKVFGKGVDSSSIGDFILAGRNIPSVFLTPSIFNCWIWTTTIIGAAEAGIAYGFIGGFAYGIGAGAAFYLFLLLVLKLRRMMPDGVFVTDFIGKRFSESTRIMYYILSIIIVLYIQIEMSAGLGFVFNGLFGVPFKFVTITAVAVSIVYVVVAGMRRILYNDLINFIVIAVGFSALVVIVASRFDTNFLYAGMQRAHFSDPDGDVLRYFNLSGLRYLIAAVFVGLSQLVVDPGFYLKAHIAKDEKTIRRSFFIGGVFFFIPVAILSGIVFGSTSLALGLDIGGGGNTSITIASEMITEYFGLPVHILVGLVLTAVAMTTLITSQMGIMALATLDIFPRKLNPDSSEGDRLKFARIFMAMIGLIGGLIAISLENISLLTMDVFCGIVFSAALGVLVIGFFSNRILGSLAIVATVLGAVSGVTVWLVTLDDSLDWFYGTIVSFIVPIAFLYVVGFFTKDKFNFYSLKM